MRTPYPGLRSFEPSESDLFFGRDGCVDEMLDLLAQTHFLAVLGTSGSGKSSLVRTGLLDSLELGFLPGAGNKWLVADIHPGSRPLLNLAQKLIALQGHGDGSDATLLESFLTRGPRSLVQWCKDGNLPPGSSLLLLVDQFEELFRYQDYAGQEKAEAFVAMLLESAQSDVPIYIVLTMRSEFLGACALMPGLAEKINQGLYLTRRMTRLECQEAIEGPASVLGFSVEPQLVNRILNDLATFAPWDVETAGNSLAQLARRADQLPLMQHVLNRLWISAEGRQGECVLKYDDYDALGGLRGALDAHASEVTSTLSEPARQSMEGIFRALCDGNHITDAVRNPCRFGELEKIAVDSDTARTVVEAFRAEGCNFLRPPKSQSLDKETVVDLGHESLIRQWSSMETWLANEARDKGVWRRLVTSHDAYIAGEGDLLSGLDLENARHWWDQETPSEAWAAGKGGDYHDVKAFLDKSIDEETARLDAQEATAVSEKRALRRRAMAFLSCAVIAFLGALFAFSERQSALEARTEALEERAAAEKSEKFTLEATDKFLVGIAGKLRRSIGVPREDVEQMFGEAENFLERLEGEIRDPDRLIPATAGLAIERARYAWVRDEFELALDQASDARMALESLGRKLSGDEIDLLADAKWFAVQNLFRTKNYSDARNELNLLKEFVASYSGHIGQQDSTNWTARFQSTDAILDAIDEDWPASRINAEKCLGTLAQMQQSDDWARDLELFCRARQLLAATKLDEVTDSLIIDVESALDLIPEQDKSRGDWKRWLWVNGLIADAESARGQNEKAVDVVNRSIRRAERLAEIEKDDMDWRAALASGHLSNGFYRSRADDLWEAHRSFVEAASVYRELEPTFYIHPNRATDYLTTLKNIDVASASLDDWFENAEYLRELADTHAERFRILEYLVQSGQKEDCVGCLFEPVYDLFSVRFLQLMIGEPGATEYILAAYDQLEDFTRDHLDESRMYNEAIRARGYMSDAAINILAFTDQARWKLGPEAVTDLAIAAISRAERQLQRFPRDGHLRHTLGRLIAMVAETHNAAERPGAALDMVKMGVEIDAYGPKKLLSQWYNDGSGPLEIDLAKAKELSQSLGTHSPVSFQFRLKGDRLSTAEKEENGYFIRVFPSSGKTSIVDDIIWRSRVLHGLEVHPDEISRLRAEEETARNAGVAFPIHAAKVLAGSDVSCAFDAETLMNCFYRELDAADPDVEHASEAIGFLARSASLPELRPVLADAIRRIIRQKDDPRYDRAMAQITYLPAGMTARLLPHFQKAGKQARDTLATAEAFFLGLLREEFDVMEPRHVAATISGRGRQYVELGTESESNAGKHDIATAVTIAPDDPKTLHQAGYIWMEDPVTRALAIQKLERALELFEEGTADHALLHDTLGRAYALDADPERGLTLIDMSLDLLASRGEDIDEPAAEAHLNKATILLQAGRWEEALTSVELAATWATWPRLERQMRDVFAELAPHREFDEETLVAAREIVNLTKSIKLNLKDFSLDKAGVAIRGFDPVAYSNAGQARRGRLKHYAFWENAIWLFETPENRDLFVAAPADHVPAGGGFQLLDGFASGPIFMHGNPLNWRRELGHTFFFTGSEAIEEFEKEASEKARNWLRQWDLADRNRGSAWSPPSTYEHLLLSIANNDVRSGNQ